MGHRKLKFRDDHHRFWFRLELKVLKNHPSAAQKVRRVLHEKLGLREQEWTALEQFMINHEAVGVITQRHEWFLKECARLKKMLDDGLDPDERSRVSMAYHETVIEQRENADEWTNRVRLLWRTACSFQHTPIARALYECRKKQGWHMHPWLVQQCKLAGGCCQRECRCCEKRRGAGISFWVGHCTPACHCCMEHLDIKRPIGPLKDTVKLCYNVRPPEDDVFSNQMMEVTVWHS
jgi:hypothetical protein